MYCLLSLFYLPVVPLKKYFIPPLRCYDSEGLLYYFKDSVEFPVKKACLLVTIELDLSV